jgi:hypothetical protein
MESAIFKDKSNPSMDNDHITHVTVACAVQLGVDLFNSLVGTGITTTLGDELVSYVTASFTSQIKSV